MRAARDDCFLMATSLSLKEETGKRRVRVEVILCTKRA